MRAVVKHQAVCNLYIAVRESSSVMIDRNGKSDGEHQGTMVED